MYRYRILAVVADNHVDTFRVTTVLEDHHIERVVSACNHMNQRAAKQKTHVQYVIYPILDTRTDVSDIDTTLLPPLMR